MFIFQFDSNIEVEELKKQYNAKLPTFKNLLDDAEYTLTEKLKESGIRVQPLTSRIKDSQSFLNKVERKNSTNPFEEIRDIVGLRIVCLFLSDIKKIEEIIKENFDIIEIDNKIDDTAKLNTFDYMSVHYIAKIKSEYVGLRYDSIKDIPFEIQVRTISMDAWANISHFLEYKNENDIPPELKRDFNALSGLFYVADTHFEMFYKQRQLNSQHVNNDIKKIINKSKDEEDTPLNLDSLILYLRSKFPDRSRGSSNYTSELITELIENNYDTIQKLDRQIEKGFNAFIQYEIDNERLFADVGVVRLTLDIVDKKFRAHRFPNGNRIEYDKYEKLINS